VDGEDGANRFNESKDEIDLIILDTIMPKKNGNAAFDEMKLIRPGIRSNIHSGYSADILDAKGILQENMNFIHKPVVINDLLLKIREVLDKQFEASGLNGVVTT
jgi:DNA-binding NtrC family response regulator